MGSGRKECKQNSKAARVLTEHRAQTPDLTKKLTHSNSASLSESRVLEVVAPEARPRYLTLPGEGDGRKRGFQGKRYYSLQTIRNCGIQNQKALCLKVQVMWIGFICKNLVSFLRIRFYLFIFYYFIGVTLVN